MPRGQLRIYLGAAPGVGKTYAMLQEGHRRRERGADVVIGVVETHGRPSTIEQIGDLEVVPRRHLTYRGAELEEMDVDAIIERAPRICLVDELAHTNVPGSRTAKRYEDVELLLDAGIDVISTVNIQHLESLNDVVERITGAAQREIIPDALVRAADQVHLVDQTPEALRRRMAHGNIYGPNAPRRRWRTTSTPATSEHCVSSRSCGLPTRSTRACRHIGNGTASRKVGRPANGSSWRSPAPRRVTT
ncbi:MAG: hypothetical protein V9G12_06485 [Microthrixaceae bacterium]